jgi:small subunit ribosomal protein S18
MSDEVKNDQQESDVQTQIEMDAIPPADEIEIKKVKDDAPSPSASSIPERKKFFYTKKVCKYCTRQIDEKLINYKNIDTLKRYVMPSGKILPRRISGNCAKHQRKIVKEIKKARIIALLPFLDR